MACSKAAVAGLRWLAHRQRHAPFAQPDTLSGFIPILQSADILATHHWTLDLMFRAKYWIGWN
jgi:hypothetical protein